MIDRLKILHSIGYLHLDLKPDNILLGSDVTNKLSSTLYLIDFGIAKTYLDSSLDHLPYREDVPFQGNPLFASKYTHMWICKYSILFIYSEPSRRDDLISLVYLLAFFSRGKIPWKDPSLREDDEDYLDKIGKLKKNLTLKKLCAGRADILLEFATEVFKLEFTEEPPYDKLKHILKKALL